MEAALPAAIVTGKYDRGELTLEIAPEEIVPVLRHFKTAGRYERLSAVTGVDLSLIHI